MTRKIARRIAVRICFSADFTDSNADSLLDTFFNTDYYMSLSEEESVYSEYPDNSAMSYIRRLVNTVMNNLSDIDSYISKYSSTRKIDRISKTVLAVLRCSIAEIIYLDDVPVSVSINEAVDISKEFDAPETVSFINGVLGSIASNK